MEYICVFLIISIFVLTIMSFNLGAVDYIVELLGYGSINDNISHIMGG